MELKENDFVKFQKIADILITYYKIYDLEYNTNHHKIFWDIYLSNKPLSYIDISNRNFIAIETFYKYKRKYNTLAEKLLLNDNSIFV